ncbi:MAG: hypothetical protein HONBIEJF_01493 [Fimbriimonadaceae bacterium]|nr:hypothetical protein [Fimbriimonadaceae bacterium]
MVKTGWIVGLAIAGIATAQTLQKKPEPAPELNFELAAVSGKNFTLKNFRGKYVVLEWWNYGCPVVQKHYRSSNIPKLQKEFMDQGVVWASIVSSAPGKQGHVTADNGLAHMKEMGGNPTDILLDPTGEVGKMFKARATPQIVLISPTGEILYNGAIDSDPRASGEAILKSENYLRRAWAEVKEGRPVSISTTQAYGCSVKYGS